MKGKRSQPEETMDIVWQTPANPPHRHDYIFRDGVRYVKPYYFEFISHAKNRWAGKTIVDLFTDEFKGRPRDYYVSAVKAGRIQVDGQTVAISYVVQPSQKISHFLHRHEPPVMAMDVQILHTEPDVVTVYKPATIPVHPCGQYRKNTIVGVLQAEHDLAPLFPIHRLDRLVSGLLIIARTASRADIFRQQIESGEVKKRYIARVMGVFPEDEQVANGNVNYNAREGRSTVEEENGPIGKNSVKGKAACTKFTRISTNGTESIVLCEPITGRTHQIRVHLQYMGHPIANDFLYLSESVPDRPLEGLNADRAAANSGLLPMVNHCEVDESGSTHEPAEDFNSDPMCTNCPNLPPKGKPLCLLSCCPAPNGPNGLQRKLKLLCSSFFRTIMKLSISAALKKPLSNVILLWICKIFSICSWQHHFCSSICSFWWLKAMKSSFNGCIYCKRSGLGSFQISLLTF